MSETIKYFSLFSQYQKSMALKISKIYVQLHVLDFQILKSNVFNEYIQRFAQLVTFLAIFTEQEQQCLLHTSKSRQQMQQALTNFTSANVSSECENSEIFLRLHFLWAVIKKRKFEINISFDYKATNFYFINHRFQTHPVVNILKLNSQLY